VPHRPIVCFDTPLAPSSPYYFGQEIVTQLPGVLKGHNFDRCFLITSRKLMPLFGEDILGALRRAGVSGDAVLIKESEQNKSWRTLRGLGERLVARGATKDSILMALGGGVIGNIVGLAAALLYRGVRFVEVPTTIMAQTDSTLSNKQAINGQRGKNQFGVYHAPLFVWADAAYAAAEPPRQQRGGIVEGIKNVFISQDCTSAAEVMLQEWQAGNRFYELLRLLIESKLSILRRDPTEKGACVILEYGHTFGHAVEWLAGNLYHGEAVAIGMCLAAETSHALGHMSRPFLQDHYRLLGTRLGVPTRLPKNISAAKLLRAMRSDNKRTKKGLRFLLLRRYGEFVNPEGDFQTAVPLEQLTEVLRGIEAEAVLPDSIIS
jgi:3-dehydroquinate synthase